MSRAEVIALTPVSPKNTPLPDDLQNLLPLSPALFFVLFALADGQKHGYAIMQVVLTLSEDKVRMGPGTLYTTLQRLLGLALVEETAGPGSSSGSTAEHEARRRYYRLTRGGKQVLEAEIDRMDAVVRRARRKKLTPRTAE